MYDTSLAQALANTIARLASPKATIIIAHEHRKDEVDACFLDAFLECGMIMETVPNKGKWDSDLSLYFLRKRIGREELLHVPSASLSVEA